MARTKTWTLVAERDKDGWWCGQIAEEPAAITQGRSLKQLQNRIREALEVTIDRDLTDRDEIVLRVKGLPKATEETLSKTQAMAERMARMERERGAVMRKLVADLKKRGLSRRDIAVIVGKSHQRVDQLLNS